MDANFTSNVGANLVTGVFFIAMWFLKNKCRHSTCDTHSVCCDCHIDDEEDNDDIKENEQIPRKAKSSMQEM